MANQRINDLTLRPGGFDTTVQFPVDDATQTYRVSGAQLKAGMNGFTTSKGELPVSAGGTAGASAVVSAPAAAGLSFPAWNGDGAANLSTFFRPLLEIFLPPKVTRYLTGSGTHNVAFAFYIAVGSATAGATYTNNGVTFTVRDTVASGTMLYATGAAAPQNAGVLTKASGTGDATLTFAAVRAPTYFKVTLVAAGGGGGGSGTSGGTASTDGGTATFGSSLLTALGGSAGQRDAIGGGGGGITVNAPAISIRSAVGGMGSPSSRNGTTVTPGMGPNGGSNPMGGAGSGGSTGGTGNGQPGISNTGGGGGGAANPAVSGSATGAGGGSGGFIEAIIPSPAASYPWAIGGTGGAGGAGGSGYGGGAGGSGLLVVEEHYQ